ncbi:hypothetical protein D3C81_1583360 [compost metagenome]
MLVGTAEEILGRTKRFEQRRGFFSRRASALRHDFMEESLDQVRVKMPARDFRIVYLDLRCTWGARHDTRWIQEVVAVMWAIL